MILAGNSFIVRCHVTSKYNNHLRERAVGGFQQNNKTMDVTKTRNGERGAGSGERGTEVWERVVSGNLHKNPKWPVRIKNPVRSMIEKRRNNT